MTWSESPSGARRHPSEVGGEGCVIGGIIGAEVKQATGCSNHWASSGVPGSAVANNLAFVAIFLGDEGKAQEGNILKFSASGSAIVHRHFPFPEADIANEEGVQVSCHAGVFSLS